MLISKLRLYRHLMETATILNSAAMTLSMEKKLKEKIALIDRGGCFFDQKAREAEDVGAIAVIICNFDPAPNGMTASGTVTEPTIPVLMIGSNDCAQIKAQLPNGVIGKIKNSRRKPC